jgi:hypothetical protein
MTALGGPGEPTGLGDRDHIPHLLKLHDHRL